MKSQLLLKLSLPLACLGILRASIIPLVTGDPIIDYMGIVVPYFGEILNVFKGFLVPIGMSLGEDIIGPVVQIIPTPDTATGFAIYFIIFAGIFLVSMYMNIIWRPKGYGKAKDMEEEKEEENEPPSEKPSPKAEASYDEPHVETEERKVEQTNEKALFPGGNLDESGGNTEDE